MNVSSLSSCCRAQETSQQNRVKSFKEDFQKLEAALKSGDLKAAQDAYTKLKQDMPGAKNSSNNSGNQFGKDFDAIGSALQSGDVSGAQKAFATFQQDIQARRSGHAHHHHHQDADGDGDSTASTAAAGSISAGLTSLNVQA